MWNETISVSTRIWGVASCVCVLLFGCNFSDDESDSEAKSWTSDQGTQGDQGPDTAVDMTADMTVTCVPSLEVCNDRDDDCNGQVDEVCDLDKDGYCAGLTSVAACPLGAGDCDDADPLAFPNSTNGACAMAPVDELSCDGKGGKLMMDMGVVQPVLPANTFGQVSKRRVVELAATQGTMVFWLEKREVNSLFMQRYSATGAPEGPPYMVSGERLDVESFELDVDDMTSSIGLVIRQHSTQDSDAYDLLLSVLDADGTWSVRDRLVVRGKAYLPFWATQAGFPKLYAHEGIFSIFYTSSDGVLSDLHHYGYNAVTGQQVGDSVRVLSASNGFIAPSVGWRLASGAERHGRYMVMYASGGEYDLLEFDATLNEVTASYKERADVFTGNLHGLSHGFETAYMWRTRTNTTTTVNGDYIVSAYRYDGAGSFELVNDSLTTTYALGIGARPLGRLDDRPDTRDSRFLYRSRRADGDAEVVVATLDETTMQLSGEQVLPLVVKSKKWWDMAYRPARGGMDEGVVMLDHITDQGSPDAHSIASYSLTRGSLEFVQSMFAQPDESPYPYRGIPNFVGLSESVRYASDGSLEWVETYIDGSRRGVRTWSIPVGGTAQAAQDLGELMSEQGSSLTAFYMGERIFAWHSRGEDRKDAQGEVVGCVRDFTLYEHTSGSWQEFGSAQASGKMYTLKDATPARRCTQPRVGAGLYEGSSADEVRLVMTHDESTDPALPITTAELVSSARMVSLKRGDRDVMWRGAPSSGLLARIVGSERVMYSTTRDAQGHLQTLSFHDSESYDAAAVSGQSVLDEVVNELTLQTGRKVTQLRVAAVSSYTQGHALTAVQVFEDGGVHASLLIFDAQLGTPAQVVDLGDMPVSEPAWTVSSHDAFGLMHVFDGEKFVLGFFSVMAREGQVIDRRHERFVRVVWPDGTLAPAAEYYAVPAELSYTYMYPMPVDHGVMLLFQDKVDHHLVHLDDTLSQELQRITFKYGVRDRSSVTSATPLEMPISSARIMTPQRLSSVSWRWVLWSDSGHGSAANTVYDIAVKCQ